MSDIFESHKSALKSHWHRLQEIPMRKLFADNPDRFSRMSVEFGNVLFDYSKNHLDEQALAALVGFAEGSGLKSRREAMFAGERINETEGRSVLHVALRDLSGQPVMCDGEDVMPQIREVRARMSDFCDAVRAGEYTVSGNRVTDVINLGIGGSDLGPKMVQAALSPWSDVLRTHFVSNVDPSDISDVLADLDPETTLFIIASKTFTTRETMANANAAKAWLERENVKAPDDHFCAVSTNLDATRAFGISDDKTFGFWEWVGGRYSVWGSIGLPVMMAIGADAFEAFLSGAHAADMHFRDTEFAQNIPVLMGLLSVWHRNICGHGAHAVLPYDNRLVHFPGWLQQLAMESNGKSVTRDGKAVNGATCPVIFGEPGTNGQHAFFQQLHQGTDIVPCDFLIASRGSDAALDDMHRILLANCLAQSQAMMAGRTLEEAEGNAHRVFAGNRPSNTFVYPLLDPQTLGMTMAFYEHKTFVEGVFWGVNSFDQFGVELGKELATSLEPLIGNDGVIGDDQHDASTLGLLDMISRLRQE